MRSACTLWRGATTADGYPARKARGVWMYVHREVLAGALGRPIRRGMVAAHICHCRRCISPAHLVECTQGENVRMSVRAGRYRRA